VLSFDGLRTPVEGVQVAFFEPDGTHAATLETDGEGVATAELAPGGAVVAFVADGPAGVAARTARAVLGVAPGDQIAIGGDTFGSGDFLFNMTITLPVLTGAGEYVVFTPCGTFSDGSNVVPLAFNTGCDVDTFAYLAVATGDAGPSFLREDEAPVIPSGNYDSPQTWQMTPVRPFRFNAVPDEVRFVDTGVYAVRAGEQQLDVFIGRDSGPAAEDTLTLRPQRIPGYDATMVQTIVYAEQPALGNANVVHWLDADDPSEWDLSQQILPWMGPVSFDSATRSMRWQIVGAGEYDATYLNVIASINDGKNFIETRWVVAAPPGIEEIVLPELPDELSAFYLPDPENVYAYGQIVESDQLEGYGAARQKGFDPSYFPRREPVGSVTRASFSGMGGGGE
ncbi:MAG TPA: hypothetical protein VFU21_31110, partial [Kofleriaceae bacterium]|nr:hypothetical protein [Kofleriaceae bacterium]